MLHDLGLVYIAVGEQAWHAADTSQKMVHQHSPSIRFFTQFTELYAPPDLTQKQKSRWLKTNMARLLERRGFEYNIYLDADTYPYQDIGAIAKPLYAGWDMVICPSCHQEGDAFWHVGESERLLTFEEVGFCPLQLQCGVIAFRINEKTLQFWAQWDYEWQLFQDEDQAAFVRALYKRPLKVFLFGYPWNGGAVIAHNYGRLRH